MIEFVGTPIKQMAFSELGGITSKVTPTEYIFNDVRGETRHTKQFGKTDPPTITLKRAVDHAGTAALMAWHQLARLGDDTARSGGTLVIFDAGGNRQSTYVLEDAWLSEINITSVKAGAADVAMVECKITCQEIWIKP
ncbi:phage tail protein [Kribbella sp. DT2]|uniref:phage tail protein n=1 Tax=Kribbella sp. DT2 TaxID=3393427 RepID=UPI003CF93D5F